ncbi:MAG TPA: hypothetical protein DER26_03200 [Verrucomicrobia bacterium]|nr:hypothetical protein [Verrucomicrobiota bacterium]
MDWTNLVKVVAVLALLVVAAALATPPGRLPLALRGLNKLLRRDRGLPADPGAAPAATASTGRRILAFVLVMGALALALFT